MRTVNASLPLIHHNPKTRKTIMTIRGLYIQVLVAGILLACVSNGAAQTQPAATTETKASWHSQSLTTETVTGPNGSITTRTALSVNPRMGATETKIAEPVAPGVYALRGWGIAASFAIEAPNGWIIVDTGDSTQAAAEMRETLEAAVGGKIKVAVVLGKGVPARGAEPLAKLDRMLDRSRLMPVGTAVPAVLDAKDDLKYNDGLEH